MIYTAPIPSPEENESLQRLLQENELTLPQQTDANVGLYDDGKLAGCGFLKGNMFQGIALDSAYQGEGLSVTLISALIQLAASRGISSYQIITKPSMARFFQGMGFRTVADASPYAIFLEGGAGSVRSFQQKLCALAEDKPDGAGCVVMNCNPFTKGHRYLIEYAAKRSPWLWVLAVEEDRSEFPFRDRFALMQEGTRDLKNVTVLPGGEYVISSKTFPSYFTRQERLASAQGAMDAAVFAQVVAPALKIGRRYVGSEPLSPVTETYNQALLERLPKHAIAVEIVERLQNEQGIISASAVRQMLRCGQLEQLKSFVPDCTYRYLRSGAADAVIHKLKLMNQRSGS